jgi:hypothetical protein
VHRYPSGKAAADIMGIYQTYISACCRGIKQTACGFRWRFYDGPDSGKLAVLNSLSCIQMLNHVVAVTYEQVCEIPILSQSKN